jgi:hypothetical protein
MAYVAHQIIVYYHKCNISTLQTYSFCIEFVGVDLEWKLEWHIWSFRLSKKTKNSKGHQGAWNEGLKSCDDLYGAI